MKVYISADIEGIAGISHWNEATLGHPDHAEHRAQMTREVLAACEGAMAAGASEILLKDAHDSGRNILLADLPECVRIVRGWSGHPYSMLQGLEAEHAAVVMIGYHAPSGSEGNPLAHTMTLDAQRMRLNGRPVSEFLLHATAAATLGVPVAFVSGDAALARHVHETDPAIHALAVSEGIGGSSISLAPREACRRIRIGVERALAVTRAPLPIADSYTLEVEYNTPNKAYESSWYPGCEYIGERTVRLRVTEFLDVMRALRFIVG